MKALHGISQEFIVRDFMPDPTQNNAKILEEVKATVGDIKPLSLANRFPFASSEILNQIEDYNIEECNKREDECINSLLKAAGLTERPENCGNFEEVCKFVIKKLIQRMPTEDELKE
jgi:hypothetical protein